MEKSVEIALHAIIANVANHVESESFLSSLARTFENNAKEQAAAGHPVDAEELARLEQLVKNMIRSRHG